MELETGIEQRPHSKNSYPLRNYTHKETIRKWLESDKTQEMIYEETVREQLESNKNQELIYEETKNS